MPVVHVTAPVPGSAAETAAALAAVAHAVAAALGLADADVYCALVPVTAASLGAEAVRPWPVAIVHGAARPPERTAEALDAVGAILARVWDCPREATWAQWVTRER
ncbi:hypothetical protein SAMN05443575_0277 [Jatrophihabitans endophyticus]|uniref:Phenylpyruvate tautomerase PptA, 4-oxalocrotonate tautomerase family n=1 Tax=Jatrophihabitans endophyticus TaxID=1206085 RepID=A0A1M5CKT0_9ACTN|nr:hypothetical protein [Jatrophihabitans endophyticus]SHF55311.1 hypothetical protein SAMN05443575_0277 [Jatrophihabitans endophyticus]